MVSPTTPTTAIIGYLTIVAVEKPTSPGVYFELKEVKDVTPPNLQVDDVDVTHYQSPGRTREYIAGFIEGGEAACTMNRVPGSATEDLILLLQSTGARTLVKVTWPNGIIWTFRGHVKGYETTSPVDGVMEATATWKVDSSITVIG
jgi:hypothetical protein